MEFIQIMYTAYIEAVYFTEDNPDLELSDEFCHAARADCEAFYDTCEAEGIRLEDFPSESVGHDFWLTRNRHGSGFRDKREIYGNATTQLTDIAQTFREVDEVW